MRVLHCIYDDPGNPWVGGGGAERVLEIYRRLTDDVNVEVLAGRYPGAEPLDRDGVRYRYVGARRPYPVSRLTYGRAASRELRRGEYDAALFDFSVYTPIRVPSRRVGHVVHMPIGPASRDRFGAVIGGRIEARERRMLRRARLVSTTSEWMAAQLRPLIPPDASLRVVRSGISDEFFGVKRAEQDYLLYYGRFDWYQKGLDLLFTAVEPLLERDRDLRLVIAGRGKDTPRVRAAAERSASARRVEVVANPSRERVLELMAGALALLHPSRFEGYPVVPAEALAAGVPIVATDVGAVRELAAGAGRLIPSEDAGALTASVAALLDAPALRAQASERGRLRANALRWTEVAHDHLDFLRLVAADGR